MGFLRGDGVGGEGREVVGGRRADPHSSGGLKTYGEEMRAPGHTGWPLGTEAPAPLSWLIPSGMCGPEFWKAPGFPSWGLAGLALGHWARKRVRGQSLLQEWGTEWWSPARSPHGGRDCPASLCKEPPKKSLGAAVRGDGARFRAGVNADRCWGGATTGGREE